MLLLAVMHKATFATWQALPQLSRAPPIFRKKPLLIQRGYDYILAFSLLCFRSISLQLIQLINIAN